MKLKNRIIFLVAGTFVLCSICFVALSYFNSGNMLTDQITNRQFDLANKTAETIDQWFEVRMGMVAATAAAATEFDPEDPERTVEKFALIATGGDLMSVYLGLDDGSFYESSGWVAPEDFDPRKRPWYIEAIEQNNGETIATKPYVDANTGDMIISLASPVIKEGRAIGVVGCDIAINFIVDMVLNTKLSGSGYALITHSDGTILVHPNKDIIGKKVADMDATLKTIQDKIEKEGEGTFEYSFKGEEKLLSFSGIPSTGWHLQLTAPKKAMFKPLYNLLWLMVILGCAFVAIGSVISYFVARSIAHPIEKTKTMIEELAKGHLDIRLNINRKDEIGQMARTMDDFAGSLQTEIVDPLQKLANGDISFSIIPVDQNDKLRNSIKKVSEDLNTLISQIQNAGEQIDSASAQVADSSQTLSQGATETAASLEEISSSISEVAAQATQSASNADTANSLAGNARKAADDGNQKMQSMVAAMTDISESGQNISKIIKTIDEIAFQTNLLALNAAVEAARAGQHGKGFAVVAEEVRNLAARSAKAAEETASLIEGSIEKTQNGSQIATETSAALEAIVTEISRVTDLVGEIAAASNEQAQGVSQINQGLGQIDQAVQQNTATSEESAAAAEELSSQAAQLKQMLSRFVLAGDKSHSRTQLTPATSNYSNKGRQPVWQEKKGKVSSIQLDDTEFGRF